MALAEAADVAARLGRTLTTDETGQVTALLEDAEILIRDRIPDLDQKIADDELSESIVVMVESNAVIRLLRNPDGFTSETDGTYAYQINWRLAPGELTITDYEWDLLGVSAGMFVIAPKITMPWRWVSVPDVHPFTSGG